MKSARISIKEKSKDDLKIPPKSPKISVKLPQTNPASPKGTNIILECFDENFVKERIETDLGNDSSKSRIFKINKYQEGIGVIRDEKNLFPTKNCAQKKKGSMFISELWSNKHYHQLLKYSSREKTYNQNQQVFTKRKVKLNLLDPKKVLNEFLVKDSERSDEYTQKEIIYKNERGTDDNLLPIPNKKNVENVKDQDPASEKSRHLILDQPKNISVLLNKIYDSVPSYNDGVSGSSSRALDERIPQGLSPEHKKHKSSFYPQLENTIFLNDFDSKNHFKGSFKEKLAYLQRKGKPSTLPLTKFEEQSQSPRNIKLKVLSPRYQHTNIRCLTENDCFLEDSALKTKTPRGQIPKIRT